MDSTDNLKKQAVQVISTYLGHDTGDLYDKFYQNKTPEIVLDSVRELLSEYVGEKIAKEKIESLSKSYSQK